MILPHPLIGFLKEAVYLIQQRLRQRLVLAWQEADQIERKYRRPDPFLWLSHGAVHPLVPHLRNLRHLRMNRRQVLDQPIG